MHSSVPSGQARFQQKLRVRAYPLQTTYAVGDSIDWHYHDTAATERATEGEAFNTRSPGCS